MKRRSFLNAAAAGAIPMAAAPSKSALKIKRVRYYASPGDAAMRQTKVPGLFNQSTNVVVVETDGGISGIGTTLASLDDIVSLFLKPAGETTTGTAINEKVYFAATRTASRESWAMIACAQAMQARTSSGSRLAAC